MNTDFRVSIGFKNHTKTKKLKKILGSDGVLSLVFLWGYTAQHKFKTGILTEMDSADIADEAGWKGNPDEFVNTLHEVGFLDKTESGDYAIHGWSDINLFAIRADTRSKQAQIAVGVREANKAKAYEEIQKKLQGMNGQSDHPKIKLSDEKIENDLSDDPIDKLIDDLADDPLSFPLPSSPSLSLKENSEHEEPSNLGNLTAYLSKLKFIKEISELFPVNEYPTPKCSIEMKKKFYKSFNTVFETIDNAIGDFPALMPMLRKIVLDKKPWYDALKNTDGKWLLTESNRPEDNAQLWWEVLWSKSCEEDLSDYEAPLVTFKPSKHKRESKSGDRHKRILRCFQSCYKEHFNSVYEWPKSLAKEVVQINCLLGGDPPEGCEDYQMGMTEKDICDCYEYMFNVSDEMWDKHLHSFMELSSTSLMRRAYSEIKAEDEARKKTL